jgi:hypothetical protein
MSSVIISGIIISLIALGCIGITIIGLKKALSETSLPPHNQKRFLSLSIIVITAWVILVGVLAFLDVFAFSGLPPRPMFTVLFALIGLTILSFTPTFKSILRQMPVHWLILFQSFRIAVELWFWHGYQTNVFPRIMTFEGANYDIIAGGLAIIVGWIIYKQPEKSTWIAVAFNILGFLILLNTLRAAALSMPSPIQQYPFDERLLQLGNLPFIFLPSILVAMGLGYHILSLRQLYLKSLVKTNAQKS